MASADVTAITKWSISGLKKDPRSRPPIAGQKAPDAANRNAGGTSARRMRCRLARNFLSTLGWHGARLGRHIDVQRGRIPAHP
jgi:hypothetical protein